MRIKKTLLVTACCISVFLSGCQRTDPPAPVVHADEAAPRLSKKRPPARRPQALKKAPAKDMADERIVLRPIPDEKVLQPAESQRIVLRQPQEKQPPKGKAFEDEILASVEGMEEDQKQALPSKTPVKEASKEALPPKQDPHTLPDKPTPTKDKEVSKASKDLDEVDESDDSDTAALPLAKGAAAVGAGAVATTAKIATSPKIAPAVPSSEEDEKKTQAKEDTSASRFAWPLSGAILKEFCQDSPTTRNDGLNISAALKAPVKASKTGTVVYIGNDIKGFGNLVLVKHDGPWMTAYAHLDSFAVSRGQTLKAGEVLGYVGKSGGVSEPQLHFEVRKNSVPVNPRLFLGS